MEIKACDAVKSWCHQRTFMCDYLRMQKHKVKEPKVIQRQQTQSEL